MSASFSFQTVDFNKLIRMSANLIRALLLIACVAGLHAGLVRVSSSRAPCPDFTTKPDFDYLQVNLVTLNHDA